MNISSERRLLKIRLIKEFMVPAVILAILTIYCLVSPVDLAVSQTFYTPESGGWKLRDGDFFRFIYNEGLQPAIYVTGAAMLVLLVGFHYHSLRRMRKVALYLVLVMVIGPGLLVNAVLKEHWGRPRPRDVENFGGKERFEKVWEYDASSPGKSFPSGHASMGFFFFAAYFLLRGWGRWWALGTLAGALILGGLLGFTRIVQGGHFFSDIVWSAGICYFVSLGLFYALKMHRGMSYDAEPKRFAPWQWGVAAVVLVAGGLLTVSIPYHEEKEYRVTAEDLSKMTLPLLIDVELNRADVLLAAGEEFVFNSDVEGFGLPGSRVKDSYEVETKGAHEKIRLSQKVRGFFVTSEQPVDLTFPPSAELVDIAIDRGGITFDAANLKTGQRVKLKTLNGDIRLHIPPGLAVRIDLEKESKLTHPTKVSATGLSWDEKEQRWKRGSDGKAVIEVTLTGRLMID